jgi:hypothetical protein
MLVVLSVTPSRKAHRSRCLANRKYSGMLCGGYLGLVHNCECWGCTGVGKVDAATGYGENQVGGAVR